MSDSSPVLCECGCGRPAPIAPTTDRKRGYEKGNPRRFIRGHHSRYPRELRTAPTEVDRAWAAGIFDGEGTVYITPRRSSYALVVSIGQTSLGDGPAPMLLKLRGHYGGSLSSLNRPGRRPHHVWALSCESAEDFLRSIAPFVVQKSGQVEIALTYRAVALGRPELGLEFQLRLRAAKH